MSRDSGWSEWMTPIIQRAIDQGKSERRFLETILPMKRKQVRALFRELKRRKAAS
jgi:hypothetical protein